MITIHRSPGSPLSLPLHLPQRSSPSRIRSAAPKPRALDRSGPFRKRILIEGKGGNCKGNTVNPIPKSDRLRLTM